MIRDRWQRVHALVREAISLPESEQHRYLDEQCGADQELRGQVDLVLALESEVARRRIQEPGSVFAPSDLLDSLDGRDSTPGSSVTWTAPQPLSPGEIVPPSEPSSLETVAAPDASSDSLTAPADGPPPAEGHRPVPRDGSRLLRTGLVLGPYRIQHTLGEGGMGAVYLAEQTSPVSRQVAIKLIKAGMDTRDVVSRFNSERQVLARMNHPHIARVFEAGATPDGRPYFVMEYVPGRPITRYCDEECLSTTERIRLFLGVCEAIQHAHQKGIIHRDIKPSNVLVTLQDGKPVPKVIDFGIAKATGDDAPGRSLHTRAGVIVGTPDYMSPEQAGNSQGTLDTRSDVYSLGVLLYELLVGILPFGRGSDTQGGLFEFQRRIREEDPPRPSARLSQLASEPSTVEASRRGTDRTRLIRALRGELDWIALRALEREPARRYSSASELAADLERYLRKEPVLAGPPGTGYRVRKFLGRHRALVSGAALFVVMLLGALVWVSIYSVQAVRAREEASAEATKASATSEFLEQMLTAPSPQRDGREVKVVDVLERAAGRVEEVFADQPTAGVAVRNTIGRTYLSLSLLTEAREQFELAEQTALPLEAHDPELLIESRKNLAEVYLLTGPLTSAEELYRTVLDGTRLHYGEDSIETVDVLNDLAVCLRQQGKVEEAAPLLQRAYTIRRRERPDEADTHALAHNVARLLQSRGNYAEAERYFKQSLEGFERILKPGALELMIVERNLAWLYQNQERYMDAEEIYRRVHASQLELLGPEHDHVITTQNYLAGALLAQDRLAEAEELYRRTVDQALVHMGEANFNTLIFRRDFGGCLVRLGQYAEAESHLLDAHAKLETQFGAKHSAPRAALEKLVMLYEKWGRDAEAARYRSLLELSQ